MSRYPWIPHDHRRFLLALYIVGVAASKAVHVYENLLFEPLSFQFILFFPTVLLSDAITLVVVSYSIYMPDLRHLLLENRGERSPLPLYLLKKSYHDKHVVSRLPALTSFATGLLRSCRFFFAILLLIITYLAGACELGFYWRTGQLVMWSVAGGLLRSRKQVAGALPILLEGLGTCVRVLGFMYAIARFERHLVNGLGEFIGRRESKYEKVTMRLSRGDRQSKGFEEDIKGKSVQSESYEVSSRSPSPKIHRGRRLRPGVQRFLIIFTIIYALSFFRPARKFNIMLNTVPLNLRAVFSSPRSKQGYKPSPGEYCGRAIRRGLDKHLLEFPFPDFMPSFPVKTENSSQVDWLVDHLPKPVPAGFERFTKEKNELWLNWTRKVQPISEKIKKRSDAPPAPKGYHQSYDPFKVSNLHLPIHSALFEPGYDGKKSLKEIKIRNIVLITLESTRMQVFPLRRGSQFTQDTLENRSPGKRYDDIGKLTKFAEEIMGKEIGKGGAGGLVVEGGLTGSSFTSKSMLITHCGSDPLSAFYFEEANGKRYQPCLPHVLNLLNQVKKDKHGADAKDWRSAEWVPHFAQSVAASWDREFNELEMMGFNTSQITTKETLEGANAKFPLPSTEKELHYLGYREQPLKPYLRDLVRTSKKQNKRFFLSHLTSTSHWPFTVPDKPQENGWKKGVYTDSPERNDYLDAGADVWYDI